MAKHRDSDEHGKPSGGGGRQEAMAAVVAQQAHGKSVDRSTYLVTTFAAASFVDLDGE